MELSHPELLHVAAKLEPSTEPQIPDRQSDRESQLQGVTPAPCPLL